MDGAPVVIAEAQTTSNGKRPTREQLLAVVERSPACVAVHDREGWLALFSDDSRVEDPMGSPPAPKRDGTLARFWDTFIAPHEIHFEVHRDLVVGLDVMRDVIIHTRVAPGVAIDVPAYLLYQLEEVGGALKVRRMAAHWELPRLSLGALTLGPRAWVALTKLFGRMIARMGLAWVGGYLGALVRGFSKAGVGTAQALANAVTARDPAALAALFDGAPAIELGERKLTPEALFRDGRDGRDGADGAGLPAGSTLTLESPVPAGPTVSFRYRISGPEPSEGLALLELAGSTRISRARFFPA